jgi:cell division protein FtsW
MIKQLIFGLVGIIAMSILALMPRQFYQRFAKLALIITIGLLYSVQIFGTEYQGNKNWITIGSVQFQPSEFAKLVLIWWLGVRLATVFEDGNIRKFKYTYFNFGTMFGIGAVIFGVLLGGDLGTAMVFFVFLVAEFYLSGVQFWSILLILAVVGVVAYFGVTTDEYRTKRFVGIYTDCEGMDVSTSDPCDQSRHGVWAVQSGGFAGVGPGAGHEKWWVQEVQKDFIFAVIGEELGFVGAMFLVLCYLTLFFALMIVITRNRDIMVKIITGTILVWISSQTLIYLFVNVGMLPVLGIPLPLISAGGTSLIATMMALGVVISFTNPREKRMKQSKRQVRGIKTVTAT